MDENTGKGGKVSRAIGKGFAVDTIERCVSVDDSGARRKGENLRYSRCYSIFLECFFKSFLAPEQTWL